MYDKNIHIAYHYEANFCRTIEMSVSLILKLHDPF